MSEQPIITNRYDRSFTHVARFYAYSQTLGRKRIPVEHAASNETAIKWAEKTSAINVIREEGPPSKPSAVTTIWERNPRTTTTTVIDSAGNVYSVPVSALTLIEAAK